MTQSTPVWAEGREKEMNLTLGFRGVFNTDQQSETILRVAASTVYRLFPNGEFVGSGPVHAGQSFVRLIIDMVLFISMTNYLLRQRIV